MDNTAPAPSQDQATHYACPVCQETLNNIERSLVCVNNHHFDRHKKGYVNLLLSQHKNSKNPGDNSEMVKGRRAFLAAGHYQAFADHITQLVNDIWTSNEEVNNTACSTGSSLCIVDAGCGEGFYTSQLPRVFSETISAQIYGLDISKPAIQAAANNKSIEWAVASNHRLPFPDDSIDMLISIFSPINNEEFLRVLKPHGYVVYAASGDHHLDRLRSIIYNTVNSYSSEKHSDYFSDSFTLIKTLNVQVPIQLNDHESIMQLVNMTPHAHRIPKAGYERLLATHQLQDTGDFKIYLYQKMNLNG